MTTPVNLTALVTGAGAPVGVSIFKALRQSALRPRIVATDADPLSVGLYRADASYVLPRATENEADYLKHMEQICTSENVSIVCFGSEIEMRRLAPYGDDIERRTGAKLILNRPHLLEAFMDKWGMALHLREKGLPVADSVLANDPTGVAAFMARHAFPFVLKPRHGSGSKNVIILRNQDELDFFSRYVPEPILQEYLIPDDEEYTVGVYKSKRTGYVGQIVLKRGLGAGVTYKAEVVRDEEIESVCRRIVESFDIWGPINVQLRKTAAGVRVFEINLRFSSSAVMRAYFGFNEPEMSLRDTFLCEALPPPDVQPGYALRYWDEIFLAPGACAQRQTQTHISVPQGVRVDDF